MQEALDVGQTSPHTKPGEADGQERDYIQGDPGAGREMGQEPDRGGRRRAYQVEGEQQHVVQGPGQEVWRRCWWSRKAVEEVAPGGRRTRSVPVSGPSRMPVPATVARRESATGRFDCRLAVTALVKGEGFGPAPSICRAYPLPTTTHRALVSTPNVQTKLAVRLASWTATCSEAVGGCLLIRQTLIMASSMHRKDYKHSLLARGRGQRIRNGDRDRGRFNKTGVARVQLWESYTESRW